MPRCASFVCYGDQSFCRADRFQKSKWISSALLVWGFLLADLSSLCAGNIEVAWDANKEPDVAGYRVYYGESSRQYKTGVIDVGGTLQYVFTNLAENKTYYFAITAYDTAGNESEYSFEVSIKVPAVDKTPPAVQQARALDLNTLMVSFSEPVSQAAAENRANYAIDQQITIMSANLQADTLTVKLSTSTHAPGKTYLLTIRNLADRAAPANVMSVPATVTYSVESADKSAPAIVSAKALDHARVEIIFDERISRTGAERIESYSISPGVTVFAAALQNDQQRVILQTGPHLEGATYQLTARNISDLATPPNIMPAPATVSYTLTSADNMPPALVSVSALDAQQIEIAFDERIAPASAERMENYGISPGITVFAATLQNDERRVVLQTGLHTEGVTYQLTARNISDLVTPPNIMPTPATLSYSYHREDHEPPRVVSVTLTDLNTLLVSFNEKVTILSTENPGNYQLSDGIQLLSARLNDEGQEVRLQTSLHTYNHDYTLTLTGITDVSAFANTIPAGLVFTYRLEQSGDKENGNLTVNGWSPVNYKLDSLRAGAAYYVDRPHTITSMPSNLNQALLLRTAYRDRRNKTEVFLEFNLNRSAEVYVAYDGRVPEVPNWLKHYFVETSQKISLSAAGEYMKLWRGRYLPGRVRLGGNMAQGMQYPFTISPNMFFVLIKAAGSDEQPSASAPPKLFEVSQNYPNPLRLNAGATRSVIACQVRQEGRVVVTIYNMLGQAVRTLHDGILTVGTHTMAWDGRDGNLESVPSGKYMYVMEMREEMQQGAFTVTAALSRETRVMTVLK